MGQDERELLKALYEDYLVPLKKLAVKIGIDYDDIEDTVHDTILTFYERYPLDWTDKQKRAMLARIMHSKWVDSCRKRSHCSDLSVEDTEDNFHVMKKLMDRDVLTLVVNNETYREVRKIIGEMKKDWRDVIVLYTIEERPFQEVCETLGISGTVCRSRITRARKYLREKMKDAGLFMF